MSFRSLQCLREEVQPAITARCPGSHSSSFVWDRRSRWCWWRRCTCSPPFRSRNYHFLQFPHFWWMPAVHPVPSDRSGSGRRRVSSRRCTICPARSGRGSATWQSSASRPPSVWARRSGFRPLQSSRAGGGVLLRADRTARHGRRVSISRRTARRFWLPAAGTISLGLMRRRRLRWSALRGRLPAVHAGLLEPCGGDQSSARGDRRRRRRITRRPPGGLHARRAGDSHPARRRSATRLVALDRAPLGAWRYASVVAILIRRVLLTSLILNDVRAIAIAAALAVAHRPMRCRADRPRHHCEPWFPPRQSFRNRDATPHAGRS